MITNKNMGNKHDERVFFNLAPPIPTKFDVTEKLKSEEDDGVPSGESSAEIRLCRKEVSPEGETDSSEAELIWKVIRVWKKGAESGARKADSRIIDGYVTDYKLDTPIYFKPKLVKVKKRIGEAWRMRIKSYREAHTETEIFGRSGARDEPWKYLDKSPGKTAWSPHQYQDNTHRNVWSKDPHGRKTTHDALELKAGDMVYARCKFNNYGEVSEIEDLFPVMISRELYDASPEALLDESLRPAMTICQLSPADRLFGWGSQKEAREEQNEDPNTPKSYKSRVRVVCDDGPRPEIVQRFDGGGSLPLTILGQPKPGSRAVLCRRQWRTARWEG